MENNWKSHKTKYIKIKKGAGQGEEDGGREAECYSRKAQFKDWTMRTKG